MRVMFIKSLLLVLVLVGLSAFWADSAQAECAVRASATYNLGDRIFADVCDQANGAKPIYNAKCNAGESFCEGTDPNSYARTRTHVDTSLQVSVDTQIKASAGWVSHVICQGASASAVAGTIILYDSLTETGTVKFTFTVAALDYHVPIVFPIQSVFSTGIFLGYTTTTNVACQVFYK